MINKQKKGGKGWKLMAHDEGIEQIEWGEWGEPTKKRDVQRVSEDK